MAWATARTVRKVIASNAFEVIEGAGGAPNAAIATSRGFAVRNDGTASTTLYVTVDYGTTWTAVAPSATTDFAAITVDGITEHTPGAGVTIEGFALEDLTASLAITTSNVPVTWTHTANGAADDLTLAVAGAFDSSLILQSAGTGADAVSLIASAGGMNVDAATGLTVTVSGGAIEVDASGAISVESSAGAIAIAADAVNQALNLGTGGARLITIGSAAANGVTIDCGVAGLNLDADTTIELDAGGAVSVESSGGAISIGADAVAQAVNIATGGAARAIAIGNAASASLTMEAGVGAATIDADGVVELNSSAAAISIGNDNVAQAVNIATAGARPINIGSAAANGIVFDSGVAGINMDADTTIDIDAGGNVTIDSSAGTIGIGVDNVAQAVNIATAGARAVTIGSATAAGVDIDAGTDDLNLLADDDITITAGLSSTWSISANDAADQTLTLDSVNAGAGKGYVVVTADDNVSLGDGGNPTLTLSGTGNVIVGDSKVVVNAAAEVLNFHDDVFQVVDPADVTKIVRVDAGNVTAGQTRVLTMADRDVNVGQLDVVQLADPGTGNAIPVDKSYSIALTTGAGAETNTLAIPTFVGQTLTINLGSAGGGTRTVTVDSAINQAGNTQIAFTQAQDFIKLEGVRNTSVPVLSWKVITNDGCGLA